MTVEVDVTSPTAVTVDLTEGVTVGGLQAERNARIAGDAATLASAATDATTKANAAQAAANAHADSGDATETAARAIALAAEAAARANADTAEATARASTDTAEAVARAAADALLIPLAQKAAAGGVATLDGSGTIPDGQIPATVARDAEVVLASTFPTYVAKSDGSSETSAFQAALTATPSGQVLWLVGTVSVDSVTVPAGVTLDGPGTVKARSSADMVKLSAGAKLRNVTLDGNSGVAVGNVNLVKVLGDNVSVRNCTLQNASGIGVTATAAIASLSVIGNTLTGLGGNFAISTSGGLTRGVFSNNIIDSCSGGGIQVYHASSRVNFDIVYFGNTITGCPGIPLEIQFGLRAVVMSNTVSAGSNGVSVGTCQNVTVASNTITNQTRYGMEMGGTGGAQRQTITGNVVSGCVQGIVYGTGPVNQVTISGNTIVNTTGAADLNGAAIQVGAVVNDLTIVGNTIQQTTVTYVNSDGIRIAAACQRVTIEANTISDVSNGVHINISSATDVVIRGNNLNESSLISHPPATFIRLSSTSRVVVAANKIACYTANTNNPVIRLSDGAADVSIIDNNIGSSNGAMTQTAIAIDAAATCSRLVINDNRIRDIANGVVTSGAASTGHTVLRNLAASVTTPYTLATGDITDLPASPVDVNTFETPAATTGTWTASQSASAFYGGQLLSTGTQNDAVTFNVPLAAGTYTLDLFHLAASSRGIYTIKIDGVTIGTVDGYNASTTPTRSTVTGITITGSGMHTVQFVMATKNASSSNYFGGLSHLTFTKTA